MQSLRSFEESNIDRYGDILSLRHTRTPIRVGLLLFGYFEYWRMFPDNLRDQVEEDLQVVESKLRLKYEVVCTDIVDTLDAADISGRILKESQIDAVILVMGTYVPDYISMHALNYLRDVPLIVFSAQHTECIDAAGTYIQHARDSCITGTAQLTGTLRKIGRQYSVVVGSVRSEEAYLKLDRFLNSVQAIHDLREVNIGVLGNVFRGMYDIELSKTFLKGTFDVNVIYIQDAHLIELWEGVTEAETNQVAEKLQKRFTVRGVNNQDILHACRLAVAMQKLAEQYHLDAMCVLDQYYLQRIFKTTVRIGGSLLLEEKSIPVSFEGDLGSAVMSLIMQSLSKKNPIQGNWCGYDQELNACIIGGHGVADPRIAGSDDRVTLTCTPETWGMEGSGLNYEFTVKAGTCTVASLMETESGYSMLISKVESLDIRLLNRNELYAVVRVKQPVKEYLENLFKFGVTQHCILCQDDITNDLELVAAQLKLKTLVM